jgi:hypothetical protein
MGSDWLRRPPMTAGLMVSTLRMQWSGTRFIAIRTGRCGRGTDVPGHGPGARWQA